MFPHKSDPHPACVLHFELFSAYFEMKEKMQTKHGLDGQDSRIGLIKLNYILLQNDHT